MLLLLQTSTNISSAAVFFHSQIEIVLAGEEGPRTLDTTTIMAIKGIPFLSVTEFVRAKLNVWVS